MVGRWIPTRTNRWRVRVLSALLVTLVAGTSAISPPAVAAEPDSACPASAIPATAFADTVRSPHRAAIDCLAW